MATAPLTQFHPFPSLPYELRLKIYNTLLNEPRTVKINCEKSIIKLSRRRYLKSYTSSTPIPPLLHTSHESRAEALTHYQPLFRTEHSPSYIYINFDTDTINLADGIMTYLAGAELEGIRRLELQVEDAAYFGHYNLEILSKMRGLREVELVAKGEDRGTWQPRGHFLRGIMRDLKELRRENPLWDCPRVRLMHADSGEEFAVVEGGVWTEADEED
ncbi:hypothetical protein OCU04_003712 [Sclerotinia nivalis]|uniref:2EXR domain-containing protein n=1 Tax=Sclerotinia nivalis TaxID=352851 RepID=A0A9X0ASG8_9HELO|nr:hypothetical protein OCU04_003712 [Sclerotinia nivalis]